MYQLKQPLLKACQKEIVRQTEPNSREDKIPKFVDKTFFYFVLEAIKGENNNSITKEVFQVDKNVQSDYNFCYEEPVEGMRDRENVIQEISFSSVGQNRKTLTANLTRSEIKIPLIEDLKNLEIAKIQTKQRFHSASGHNYTNYFNSIFKK